MLCSNISNNCTRIKWWRHHIYSAISSHLTGIKSVIDGKCAVHYKWANKRTKNTVVVQGAKRNIMQFMKFCTKFSSNQLMTLTYTTHNCLFKYSFNKYVQQALVCTQHVKKAATSNKSSATFIIRIKLIQLEISTWGASENKCFLIFVINQPIHLVEIWN